ncbi:MAG: RimK/LysX family protein [Luteolibacter sp.]
MSAGKFFKNQFQLAVILMLLGIAPGMAKEENSDSTPAAAEPKEAPAKVEDEKSHKPEAEEADDKEKKPEIDPDDEVAVEEADSEAAAVARPVSADPIQIYGWREKVLIDGVEKSITAKLDTGAYTSSIHAEDQEMFERDGKKWVRFIVTEPRKKGSPRVRIEAPLVRIARIKEPGGQSESREVVRLAFKIGDRKLRGDFTLNNRANMLSAVLIGRITIRELGWIDPSRVFLADDKIMR